MESGNVLVLKSVFEKEFLLKFRSDLFEWSKNKPLVEPANLKNDLYLSNNWHRIDNNPPKSETAHIFHSFNLNRLDLLPENIANSGFMIFNALRIFQNGITGTNGEFLPTDSDVIMHPQVIQYPSGGGFFGEHIHPLEPQRIGLITNLSVKGKDHYSGGSTFKTPNGKVNTDDIADVGDITLFRYNFPHAVSIIDPNQELDWNSENGRWTMILPYY